MALATLADLRQQRSTQPKVERFHLVASRWLANRVDLRPASHKTIGSTLRSLGDLGALKVDTITTEDVRKWLDGQNASPATKAHRLRIVRSILEDAAEDGLIPRNPARKLKAPKVLPTEGRRAHAIAPCDFASFVQAGDGLVLNRQLKPAVWRAIQALGHTGMRIGELLALTWADVDSDQQVIRVTKSANDRGVLGPTKTGICRLVPIGDELLSILKTCTKDGPTVFEVTRRQIAPALLKVAAEADLPAMSPHALRRTFEGRLRAKGVDPMVRRAICGWVSERTQETYSRVSIDELSAAVR